MFRCWQDVSDTKTQLRHQQQVARQLNRQLSQHECDCKLLRENVKDAENALRTAVRSAPYFFLSLPSSPFLSCSLPLSLPPHFLSPTSSYPAFPPSFLSPLAPFLSPFLFIDFVFIPPILSLSSSIFIPPLPSSPLPLRLLDILIMTQKHSNGVILHQSSLKHVFIVKILE